MLRWIYRQDHMYWVSMGSFYNLFTPDPYAFEMLEEIVPPMQNGENKPTPPTLSCCELAVLNIAWWEFSWEVIFQLTELCVKKNIEYI